jgi:hypothetical protein
VTSNMRQLDFGDGLSISTCCCTSLGVQIWLER